MLSKRVMNNEIFLRFCHRRGEVQTEVVPKSAVSAHVFPSSVIPSAGYESLSVAPCLWALPAGRSNPGLCLLFSVMD